LSRAQLLEASRLHDDEVYDRAVDMQIMRLLVGEKSGVALYGIPLDVVQLLPCGISAAILIIRPLRSHQSVDKHAVSAPSQLACGRLET
jgi:hypothetical protein